MPCLPPEIVPRKRHEPRRGRVAEVHDDELAGLVTAPPPADEVLPGVVALPPASLGELPFAAAKDPVGDRRQQPLVERLQLAVDRLVRPAGEEHGQLDRAALELALVDEPCAGLSQRRHGRGTCLVVGEGRCRARLVVVFEEADAFALEIEGGAQVADDRRRVAGAQPVVVPLVVGVIEALLLERPLQVPVRLGDEDEVGPAAPDRAGHRRPVVAFGTRTCSLAPGALEDLVQHQHRHVATDAVALRRDRRQRLDRC